MKTENNSQKTFQYKGLFDFLKSNPDEQDCIDYFEKLRGKGKMPTSPFDLTSKVGKCKNNRYMCKNTGKYFNVRTGTELENSKISIRDGLIAVFLFTSPKKGVSSCQLARYIGITQKSAGFVLHRLRDASVSSFKEMLKDFVEIDETFVGGRNYNRHGDKKVPRCQGRSGRDKISFGGGRGRETGRLICQVVSNTQQETLKPIILDNIKEGSTIYSDEGKAYDDLYKWFNHQRVNHGNKEYARGKVHTNSIEGAWAHLKRMIYGTYHHISRKHAQKYADEFTLRYNTRKYSEQERFDLLLSSIVGKRLTYQQLIS